jgi:hypothetical protein
MALNSKKYSAVHSKTGDDKVKLKTTFDEGHINTFLDLADNGTNPEFGALIYMIQEMQDELDYLRTEISSNKDKTTFPGLGTSSTTALAGDTTTITTTQANEITANTAKISQNLKTANHTMQFDVINAKGTYTLRITVVDSTNAKSPVTKTVNLTLS